MTDSKVEPYKGVLTEVSPKEEICELCHSRSATYYFPSTNYAGKPTEDWVICSACLRTVRSALEVSKTNNQLGILSIAKARELLTTREFNDTV